MGEPLVTQMFGVRLKILHEEDVDRDPAANRMGRMMQLQLSFRMQVDDPDGGSGIATTTVTGWAWFCAHCDAGGDLELFEDVALAELRTHVETTHWADDGIRDGHVYFEGRIIGEQG